MKALLLREIRMLLTATSTWLVALALVMIPGLQFIIQLDTTWEWDLVYMVNFLNFSLALIVPALTMGAIANEREKGTWLLLRSDPVTPGQIVMTKYCVLMLFYVCTVSLSVGTALYFIGEAGGKIDLGRQIGTFMGHIFIAAWYIAIGLACSAHAKSQVTAFFSSVSIIMVFDVFARIGIQLLGPWGQFLQVDTHVASMNWGLFRFKDIFYFATGILLTLILAGRIVTLEVKSRIPVIWKVLPIPVWVVFWVFLQAHMVGNATTYDFSRLNLTHPSQQALTEVKDVGNNVKIITVWSSHDDMVSIVEGYTYNLKRHFNDMQLESYRLSRDETKINAAFEKHGIQPNDKTIAPGFIVVLRGDQYFILGIKDLFEFTPSPGGRPFRRWKGEYNIVKVMMKLSRQVSGKIAILDEADSDIEGSKSLIDFDPLRYIGFKVDNAVKIKDLDPQVYPLVFFINPKEHWQRNVVLALREYRQKGGKLVVCAEADTKISAVDRVRGQLKNGPDRRNPGLISAQLPDYLQKSFGDPQIVFNEPFVFNEKLILKTQDNVGDPLEEKLKVFFRDRRSGYPISVTSENGLTLVGDTDWFRVPMFRLTQSNNANALQMFVEFMLGVDEHHYVEKKNLDVPIQKLQSEAREKLHNTLIFVFPGILLVFGTGLALWRRYT